ncbi:MAG: hypothetical protein HXY35_06685 [Chloroflexi bacterium]|nr:hypothetical protein [Chloroflexota bacterium]
MKKLFPVLLAVLALVASSLACSLTELSLENARMAFDENGENVTSTYSSSDVFYAVADLNNAPTGTAVVAKWIAVNIEGEEPGSVFQEQTLDITEDSFTGTIYFQLSNDSGWPSGDYKVELYLNGTLTQSVSFNVQ